MLAFGGADAAQVPIVFKVSEGVRPVRLTTVYPTEIDGPLVNPYCGWGIWAGPRFFDSRQFSIEYNTKGFGNDAPLFSWVLIDWMWSDLEPKEGQFDWKGLDAIVDYWTARNKQLVVRLWVTTDPGWAGAPGNKACPDWLWDAGVKYHSYNGEGGAEQRCPAYADPTWETIYLPKLKRFLAAYRDRYHKPGNPIILDHVMGFGDWGEWHTMWSHYRWPSREKRREVLGKAIGTYLDVFAPHQDAKEPVRRLAIAHVYDDDCGGDTPLDQAMHRQALDIAVAKGFALTRNGFIDGLGGWPNDLMARYWKTNQLVAEANWSYEQVKWDKTHGTMAEHVDAYVKWHSAHAHMYMHADSYRQAIKEDWAEVERALRPGGIGYRFLVTSASWESTRAPGQTLTLRQQWINRNSSWCVYPYRLKLYLMDSGGKVAWSGIDEAFDPRPWVSGADYPVESGFRLPEDLKRGTYELCIALADASGTPRVRLAITGADELRRYRLGSVNIKPVGTPQLAVAKAPDGAPVSQARYRVRLRAVGTGNWQTAPVYAFFQQYDYNDALTAEPQFVICESTGDIEVEVTVVGPAKSPVLRPLSRHIALKQDGQTLRFTINDAARQICLELNDDPRHPLLLFTSPAETNVPKANTEHVTYFGPGYHKAGPIKCSGSEANGRTIYLAPGAVVEGSVDISGNEGVTVRGRGILYSPCPKDGNAPVPLAIFDSKNVRVEGVVVVNRADQWSVRPTASRNVTFENFHLLSEIRDGLDIVNSQSVTVRGSFIMAHDDAICLKGMDYGKRQPVEDVLVERCVIANMGGGNCLEIGYESVTPVYRRLTFRDLDLIYSLPNGEKPDPYWPEAAISIHPTQMTEYGDPAYMGTMPPVHDVTYQRIRIERCEDDYLFDIRPNRDSPGKGIENIRVEDVAVVGGPARPSRVVGRKDHPIRKVKFHALKILGKPITNAQQGQFIIENVESVSFDKSDR
ncbi:MAG: DUF4832 domain-containing protein [Thermoguttaceae bacterium]